MHRKIWTFRDYLSKIKCPTLKMVGFILRNGSLHLPRWSLLVPLRHVNLRNWKTVERFLPPNQTIDHFSDTINFLQLLLPEFPFSDDSALLMLTSYTVHSILVILRIPHITVYYICRHILITFVTVLHLITTHWRIESEFIREHSHYIAI